MFKILRPVLQSANSVTLIRIAHASSVTTGIGKPLDLESLFLNARIHNLLFAITCRDPERVHAPRLVPRSKPNLELVSDEQLPELRERAEASNRFRLQMPPLMNSVPLESSQVLEKDKLLEHHSLYKFAFVDTSPGLRDHVFFLDYFEIICRLDEEVFLNCDVTVFEFSHKYSSFTIVKYSIYYLFYS